MRHYLIFLLFLGCGSSPDNCVTKCGLHLQGEASCEEFQAAEDRYVTAFAHRYGDVCAQLNGRIVVLTQPATPTDCWFKDPWGREVCGYTHCYYNSTLSESVIGWTGDFHRTAFAHELTHGMENCADPDHTFWRDAGIYDDITRASNDPNP